MAYKKQHIKDLIEIMGVGKEMIRLLPHLKPKNQIFNPWSKQLPAIFKSLKLKKGQTVLDIPCGQGGVSIPLAQKYKVKVIGYDIVASYIKIAKESAEKKGVSHLCKFEVKDIREAIKQKNKYDALLWIAAPHIWGKTKSNIKALRNCVRNNGLIVIGDAYLYTGIRSVGPYRNYESLINTNKAYIAFGDKLIKFYDYKSRLWKYDYSKVRETIESALTRLKSKKDKIILKRYLSSLNKSEKRETKDMGLGIWLMRIKKGKK